MATFAFVLVGFGFNMFGLANDEGDAATKSLYNLMAIAYMVIGLSLVVYITHFVPKDKKRGV